MNKAIDVDVISVETACPACGHEYTAVFADHELAQLRADLQAAQGRIAELEEPLEAFSLAHDLTTASIDSPLLVRYAVQLEQRSAEQARQLDAARVLISMINQRVYLKRDLQVDVNRLLGANPAPAERPISAIELAAYRYYLGESDDRLCELFDDMSVDEGEAYRKANEQAQERQP